MSVATLVALVGCSSGTDGSSATTSASRRTSSGSEGAADTSAPAVADDLDRTGARIVDDATLRIPGAESSAVVYEIHDLRITHPSTHVDCPGGSPVNSQRLAAEITAYRELAKSDDVNVTPNDAPLPLSDVSQLPEVVLVGVGADSTATDKWFVGIDSSNRLVSSVPNTLLRPAPAASTTSAACALVGWQATDVAEPLLTTELDVTSNAFVPKDFVPADYQIRIGRGEDNAYCWPLDDLASKAELGRCD